MTVNYLVIKNKKNRHSKVTKMISEDSKAQAKVLQKKKRVTKRSLSIYIMTK